MATGTNGKSLTATGAKQKSLTTTGANEGSLTTTGAKEGSMATDNGGETIAGGYFIFIDDQKGETKKDKRCNITLTREKNAVDAIT